MNIHTLHSDWEDEIAAEAFRAFRAETPSTGSLDHPVFVCVQNLVSMAKVLSSCHDMNGRVRITRVMSYMVKTYMQDDKQ